jgi:hypothetical protein
LLGIYKWTSPLVSVYPQFYSQMYFRIYFCFTLFNENGRLAKTGETIVILLRILNFSHEYIYIFKFSLHSFDWNLVFIISRPFYQKRLKWLNILNVKYTGDEQLETSLEWNEETKKIFFDLATNYIQSVFLRSVRPILIYIIHSIKL